MENSRKIRKDKKYPDNKSRQKAYRLRKKVLDAYFLQLDAQAEADEFLESVDGPVEGVLE